MCSQIRCVWLVTRGEVEEGRRGTPGVDRPGGGIQGPHGGITGFGVGLGVGGQNVVGDTVGLCDCGVGRGVGLGVGGGLGWILKSKSDLQLRSLLLTVARWYAERQRRGPEERNVVRASANTFFLPIIKPS